MSNGMIKFLKDMPTKHYESNCGGKLYVDAARFIEADEAMHAGSFWGRVTMVPGSSVGYHEQNCNPAGDLELYYVVEGKMLATLNGKEDILGPGDIMVCYNGDWNGLENIGDTDATVLAMIFCSPDEQVESRKGFVRHLGDMRTKHYDHNCGGKLYLDSSIFLEEDEALRAGSYFGRVTWIPGATMGYHEQNCNPSGDFEMFYMIEGSMVAKMDGREEVLNAGDIMFCPNGVWNGLDNVSDKNAIALVMIFRSLGKK